MLDPGSVLGLPPNHDRLPLPASLLSIHDGAPGHASRAGPATGPCLANAAAASCLGTSVRVHCYDIKSGPLPACLGRYL